MSRRRRSPQHLPPRAPWVSVLAIAAVLVLGGAVGSGAAPGGGAPAAELGTGWGAWWGAHGKEVAVAVACFLDGVAAARWLALGGGALAAAGLVAAGLACFS